MTLAPTGPRDVRDAKRLAELEAVIDRGLTSFVEVGEALLEVRDSKLYRVGYETFEAYCKGRWGFSRPRAYQLMEAAEVVGALSTVVDTPATERVARELVPALRAGGSEAVRETWAEVVDITDGKPTADAVRAVVRDVAPDDRWNPGSAVMSSISKEWYTPRHIVDAVLVTMGTIDLDPCAEKAKQIPAAAHMTKATDGLGQPWKGRVYMNPPYGDTIGEWTTKLRKEYDAKNVTEAVALVPARTETDWWEALAPEHVCLIHGRLRFSDGPTAAPFPSAAVYLGKSADAFVQAFKNIGPVYRRVTR
jgi:hypothetical protein